MLLGIAKDDRSVTRRVYRTVRTRRKLDTRSGQSSRQHYLRFSSLHQAPSILAIPAAALAQFSSSAMARQGLVARAYLLAYNFVQFAGWAYCLWLVVQQLAQDKGLHGQYAAAGRAVSEF